MLPTLRWSDACTLKRLQRVEFLVADRLARRREDLGGLRVLLRAAGAGCRERSSAIATNRDQLTVALLTSCETGDRRLEPQRSVR